MAGTFPPTSGSAKLDDKEITFQGTRQICHAGISRTYQLVRPFSSLTVYENVLVGMYFGKARMGSASLAEEEVVRVLKLTGLVQKANIPAKNLTLVGRKQLEIARTRPTCSKMAGSCGRGRARNC